MPQRTAKPEAVLRSTKANKLAQSAKKRKRTPKSILKLPDLEQSKSAVLNSLPSVSSQPFVRPRDPPVHRLVLLRAPSGLQPNRCDKIPHFPRASALRVINNQPATRRRKAVGLRGSRFGLTQPGPRRRHTPGERSEEARNPGWKLAHCGTGPRTPFELRP